GLVKEGGIAFDDHGEIFVQTAYYNPKPLNWSFSSLSSQRPRHPEHITGRKYTTEATATAWGDPYGTVKTTGDDWYTGLNLSRGGPRRRCGPAAGGELAAPLRRLVPAVPALRRERRPGVDVGDAPGRQRQPGTAGDPSDRRRDRRPDRRARRRARPAARGADRRWRAPGQAAAGAGRPGHPGHLRRHPVRHDGPYARRPVRHRRRRRAGPDDAHSPQ